MPHSLMRLLAAASLLGLLSAGCDAVPSFPDAPRDVCAPNPCQDPHRTVCAVQDGQAVCACEPGYRLEGEACVVPTPLACPGTHTGDALEPDECPALARDIGLTGTQAEAHTLGPDARDEDWFRIAATAGRSYRVAVQGEEGLSLLLEAYGPDGTTRLAEDRTGASTARLSLEAEVSGTHYVRVASGGQTPGAYTVSILEVALPGTPATVARVGQSLTGTITQAGQSNAYQVDLLALHRYRVTVTADEPALNEFSAWLLAPDATTVLDEGHGTYATFAVRPTVAGLHFVRVQELSGTQTGTYTFLVEDLGADDHGDTAEEATLLTLPGAPLTGSLDVERDADAFTFAPTQGHLYRVGCTPAAPLEACRLRVLDGAGMRVVNDLAGSPPVLFAVNTPGAVLVTVSASPWYQTGPYTLTLEEVGPDDHGGTLATATALPAAGAGTAQLEAMGDVDVLSLQASAGHSYVFSAFESGALPGVGGLPVRVLDASGTVRAESNQGVVSVSAAIAETLFLQVRPLDPGQLGGYDWRVVEYSDDHSNTPAQGTPVLAPTPATFPNSGPLPSVTTAGRIEAAGDVDVFLFQPVARSAYFVTCRLLTLEWCRITVYGPNGAVAGGNVSATTEVAYAFKANPLTTPSVPFVWRIEVTNGSAGMVGDYELLIEEYGPDDHGDLMWDATPLAGLGVETPGALEVAGVGGGHHFRYYVRPDEDYYSVQLPAGTARTVTLTGPAFNVEVWDDTGVVAEGYGSVPFTPTTTGLTWVRVQRGATSPSTGSYSLRVD